jgi:hypothetical protein
MSDRRVSSNVLVTFAFFLFQVEVSTSHLRAKKASFVLRPCRSYTQEKSVSKRIYDDL